MSHEGETGARMPMGRRPLPPSPRGVLLYEWMCEQAALAQEAITAFCLRRGISTTTVGKWGTGVEPEFGTVVRVAEAMRRPLLDLLLAGQWIQLADVKTHSAARLLTYPELCEFLGVGIHTALRKAGDSPESIAAWRAIDAMEPDEWEAIVDFVARPLAEQIGIRP